MDRAAPGSHSEGCSDVPIFVSSGGEVEFVMSKVRRYCPSLWLGGGDPGFDLLETLPAPRDTAKILCFGTAGLRMPLRWWNLSREREGGTIYPGPEMAGGLGRVEHTLAFFFVCLLKSPPCGPGPLPPDACRTGRHTSFLFSSTLVGP